MFNVLLFCWKSINIFYTFYTYLSTFYTMYFLRGKRHSMYTGLLFQFSATMTCAVTVMTLVGLISFQEPF